MTEKDYLDPKGYRGDPAGNVRRMSGDSIGAFWSCLFSNFWLAAEGRSSEPFKRVPLVLPPTFRAFWQTNQRRIRLQKGSISQNFPMKGDGEDHRHRES
jgi:hypothetical protein